MATRRMVAMTLASALFQRGDFTLASGQQSDYKIECEALTDEDWATLGMLLARRVRPFAEVIGVPRAGIPLAKAMQPFVRDGAARLLVVDDVWTTGGSLRDYEQVIGRERGWSVPLDRAVVFARAATPIDVTALFRMEGQAT